MECEGTNDCELECEQRFIDCKNQTDPGWQPTQCELQLHECMLQCEGGDFPNCELECEQMYNDCLASQDPPDPVQCEQEFDECLAGCEQENGDQECFAFCEERFQACLDNP
jgi:hypothetical protein